MKSLLGTFATLLLINSAFAQDLFVAKDLTAEKQFTVNIEGPMVDKKGNLYVVNYQKDGTIGLVKPNGETSLFVELPAGSTANAIQFDSKGAMFLADFSGHNVLKVDPKTKKVTVHCHNDSFNQPNDIAINRKNQLFASDPNWKESKGQIWRIDTDGKATLLEKDMGTTNGIELSPDDRTLYVNESVQRKVWKYNVDSVGNIYNKQLFTQFVDGGMDGMKCDAEGNLYISRWGTGKVVVFSPEGKQLREIPLKGKNVSNIIFGGKSGKTAFVTLQDRGCLETFQVDVPGKRFMKK
ncbi:SMP-30/gluconolactonase/LRE family protein [Xanthocytophaga agilis]|uniref:SMP-30/gluconolactonase/LRE family protein n=1 Tax=Xanthocytophaga agilis TaxID=3048010 RepID=A0AAE3R1Y2_9BACT|nr:SMP-30/gluconolactonase/LRE family protein [Xanthocytophaga agilis]MDJ1499177.1 SMP-30/gluconolactonase/LRE family protein [Xanthocytophaga agilis]